MTNTSRQACAARYGCGFLLVTWMRYFGSWILYGNINLMFGWILYCCIYLCFKPLIYIGSIWDFIGPWKNGIWWWITAILRWNNSEHGLHYFLHPWRLAGVWTTHVVINDHDGSLLQEYLPIKCLVFNSVYVTCTLRIVTIYCLLPVVIWCMQIVFVAPICTMQLKYVKTMYWTG